MYCRRRWPEQCWCSDGTAVQESALSDGCSPFTCDNIFNANHIKRNENDFRWCKWQPCTLLVYKFCHVPPWPKAHGGQTGPNVYVVNNNYFIIHCNLIYTAIFQSSGTETNSKQEMNGKKNKKNPILRYTLYIYTVAPLPLSKCTFWLRTLPIRLHLLLQFWPWRARVDIQGLKNCIE